MAVSKVVVVDGNNLIVRIDRGVAGRGITDVEPVEIDNALYLEFTFSDGTTETVGPVGVIQYVGTAPIVVAGANISLSTVPVNLGGTNATTAANARTNLNAANQDTTITAGTGLSGGGSLAANRTINIANTAVTAGAYGSASNTLSATVNAQGQLTALAATPIAVANTQVSGLGTMSTQNANSVAITGGSVTGITDLAVLDGGTGASDASGARTNLGAAASATTITAGTGLSGGGDLSANRTLAIANTAVTAGSFGSASNTLTATVNAQGQLTALAATPIAIANTQVSGLGTASVLNAGVALGVATLDAGGTVPLSQIPASIQGGVSYQGSWNASTNTPTLTSSVGSKGYYYVVSVAGSTNLNGITDWLPGDWAIYNGTAWEKIDNTDSVASVNGYVGAVVLNAADVGAPPTTRSISTGTGLTGGGNLSADRTIAIDSTVATLTGTQTLTNKTINLASNTLQATSAEIAAAVTDETGSGALVFANSPTLVTPALGTPSALVGTNITGTAAGLTAGNVTTNANLTGAITSTGNATLLGSFSSANLAGALTDETGTGSAVFATSPTLVTPALGTPASGTVTNLTGTASININGTVGATTASTGAFTTLSASGDVTLSGGTANGVAFANGSKVLTTGSALTFDGTTQALTAASGYGAYRAGGASGAYFDTYNNVGTKIGSFGSENGGDMYLGTRVNNPIIFLQNNAEAMRLTSTGLGIGTSSPGAQLDISTTVSATGAILRLSNQSNTISVDQPHGTIQFFSGDDSGTADTVVSSIISAQATTAPNEGYLKFLTGNNTEKLRLDSSGNLGLGVVPSAWAIGKALQVNGASILSTATEMYLSANAFYGASAWTYRQTDFAAQYYQLNGAHVWRTAPSGTAGAAITFTQAMTLNASGNLGIGTSSPATKLDVRGATTATIRVGSTGSGLSGDEFGNLEFYWADEDAPGVKAKIYTKNVGNVGPGGGGAADLLFATMPALGSLTERMRLDSSGNLGLGVTPSAWGVNTRALQMGDYAALNSDTANGAANVSMNAFFNGTNWIYRNSSWPASYYNQSNGLHRWYNAPSGTAGNAISFTQAMTLDASGNLGIGTTSPSASAILDAQSTTKGVRMPNMTTTQKNAIASPAAGLMVFDTTLAKLCVYTGAAWQTITSV